ncbi:MAG TPA: L-2-amino-thiazoline-4-carboxylic acid hydrolase [Firmicutes bacterium]|nr:L-2-amino-thiazoline-4-carboxylic acid hydrolase [Bacillota bacterium]
MSTVFTEKVHAYLIGLFYRNLKEAHGQRGVECFIKCTQKMAEQRGARMALRVLRDGYELNFKAYAAYGEWTSSFPRRSEEVGQYPDKETKSYLCAWRDTFAEMDLVECGMVYCKEIDRSIVRGYNPDLVFQLKSYLHNSPCCDMVFKDGLVGEDATPKSETKKPWDYHCGHVYKTYRENILDIFPQDQNVLDQVDAQFTQAFGAEALETVKGYLCTDFNRIG